MIHIKPYQCIVSYYHHTMPRYLYMYMLRIILRYVSYSNVYMSKVLIFLWYMLDMIHYCCESLTSCVDM